MKPVRLVGAVLALAASMNCLIAQAQDDPRQPRVINVNSPTETAIRAAIRVAVMSLGPDIINLPAAMPGGIHLSAPLPLISGITYRGVLPTFDHSSSVPDNDIAFTGGTYFTGNGTFPCFQAQSFSLAPLDIDKSSPDANFTSSSVKECGIENVGMQNFSRGVSAGARNQCGLLYSALRNLFIKGCGDWGIHLVNFQHTDVSRVWTFGCGKGQRYAADVASAVLQPGNSTVSQLFDNPTSDLSTFFKRLHRGLVFEATAGSDLNEIMGYRLQANFFGKTMTSYSAVSGGSGQFTLASGRGGELQVGMPIKFVNNGGNGNVAVDQTYFIKGIAGDTITVSESRASSAVPGFFGPSTTITTYGFGNFEVIGGVGGTVTNSEFMELDLEGVAQSAFSSENMFGCTVMINELYAANEQQIVLRTSQPNYFVVTNTFASDVDGSSVNTIFFGSRNTALSRQYLGIWHGLDASSNRGTLGIGSSHVSSRPGDLTLKTPSGGQFIYPLAPIGQRILGDYSAGDGKSINAGQAGFIRCTASGTGPITWFLPPIDQAIVGLIFEITNGRPGGTSATLLVSSTGTQFMNDIPFQNIVALVGPSSAGVASARFVACDNGAGGGYYWRATLEHGATIPQTADYVSLQPTTPGTPDTGNLNISGSAIASRFGAGTNPTQARVQVNETGNLEGVHVVTTSGTAVYAQNTATSGSGFAGFFAAESPTATALYAEQHATTGSGVAGLFSSLSPNGVSLWGTAKATSGPALGVLADTASPDGTAIIGTNAATSDRAEIAGPNGSLYTSGSLASHAYAVGSKAAMVPLAYGCSEGDGSIRYIGSNNWVASHIGTGQVEIEVPGVTMAPGQYVVNVTAVESGVGVLATVDDQSDRPVVYLRLFDGTPTDAAFEFVIFRTNGNGTTPQMPEDLRNPPQLSRYGSREAWRKAEPGSYDAYRVKSVAWQREQAKASLGALPNEKSRKH